MPHQPSTPKLRPTGWDMLVVLAVVLLAAAAALWSFARPTDGELTAVVTHRGTEVCRVALAELKEEKTVRVDGTYHLTICMTPEGVSVTQSDCPGGDCVRTGTITRAGQSIVCLPEQVVVQLVGADTADGPDVILG